MLDQPFVCIGISREPVHTTKTSTVDPFKSIRGFSTSYIWRNEVNSDPRYGCKWCNRWCAPHDLETQVFTLIRSVVPFLSLRPLIVGYRRAFPGAVTSALLCATLQLVGNEFGVQRVKYISRRQTPNQTTPTIESVPSESLTQLLFRSIGFQRVAQDEYLSRLKRERAAYQIRIAELEKQIEEEKPRES